jgi:hypothetical protein
MVLTPLRNKMIYVRHNDGIVVSGAMWVCVSAMGRKYPDISSPVLFQMVRANWWIVPNMEVEAWIDGFDHLTR